MKSLFSKDGLDSQSGRGDGVVKQEPGIGEFEMDEMDEDFDEGDYFAPDKEEEEDWDSELKLDTGMMAEAQREYADDSDDY